MAPLGDALERTIHAEPSLDELVEDVALVEAEVLAATP